MGLLAVGTPMDWEEAKWFADRVRKLGIKQLIDIWKTYKGNERDVLLWGDEIEYLVVSYDEKNKNARLSLRQEEILEALGKYEKKKKATIAMRKAEDPDYQSEAPPKFHPEFGRFMLESTPGAPYGGSWSSLLTVESNMKLRRRLAKQHLSEHEAPITMTSFPRLGAEGVFTDPYYPATGSKSRSQYLPDELINLHIRFPTLAANIRARRGAKVAINMPVFYDVNTPRPFNDPTVDYDRYLYPEDDDVRNGAVKEGHIYMDAMGFGMGCCCLQITFQAKNMSEARTLYDQLAPLGPIMLALTAATPVFKGFLADVDVRWNVISGAVDDRTEEERGLKPLKNNRFQIPKSRYASVSTYLSDDPRLRPEYNDPNLAIDTDIQQELLDAGMDERLATHFAHLFIRDPLVVFRETLEAPPDGLSDHFENIQSTNWQHMRFKPPPPGDSIGWRVEFRSMEIQLTDFENAAYAIFIVLLTRAILSYGLNFYIPIDKVDENMHTAHIRDAVLSQKFHFRKDIFPPQPPRHPHASPATGPSTTSTTPNTTPSTTPSTTPLQSPPPLHPVEAEYTLFTINEIINGAQPNPNSNPPSPGFIGLIPLIEAYLNTVNVDVETRCQLSDYLDLVKKRAAGELVTGAKWVREFVRGHEGYKGDSRVGERVTYDLVKAVEKLGMGKGVGVQGVERLLGKWKGRK